MDALATTLGEDAELRKSGLPTFGELLERNGRLFAKEIEESYGIAPEDLESVVADLSDGRTAVRGTVLGEAYWEMRVPPDVPERDRTSNEREENK